MSKKRIFSALLILVLIFAMAAVPAVADKSNMPIDATHLSPDDCPLIAPHFHEKIELPEGEELTIPEDYSDFEPIDATHIDPNDCPLLVPHFHEVIDISPEDIDKIMAEDELLRAAICSCGGTYSVPKRFDLKSTELFGGCQYGRTGCQDVVARKYKADHCNRNCGRYTNRVLLEIGGYCYTTENYYY